MMTPKISTILTYEHISVEDLARAKKALLWFIQQHFAEIVKVSYGRHLSRKSVDFTNWTLFLMTEC